MELYNNINSKTRIKAYLKLLIKSFSFRTGILFFSVGLYFSMLNPEYYSLKKNLFLILNSTTTNGEVISCNTNEYGEFTVNYIFKEDPKSYIYTTYLTHKISEGKPIAIKYNHFFPEYNKSVDGFSSPSAMFLLPKIAILIGLILIFIDLNSINKLNAILKNGIITPSVLIQLNRTEFEEYKELHFEYEDLNKQKHVLSFESKNTTPLTDEETELLIYHKNKPKQAYLVDALPALIKKEIKQTLTFS